MNRINGLCFALLILLTSFFNCSGTKKLTLDKATTLTECQKEKGYWYKGKCWANFEEEGIAKDDIDAEVKKQMAFIDKSTIKVNTSTYPIRLFFPEMDDKTATFVTVFGEGDDVKTLLQTVKEKQLKKEQFNVPSTLMAGDIMKMSSDEETMTAAYNNPLATGELQISVHDFDKLDLSFSGVLENEKGGDRYQIDYRSNEHIMGAGTSSVVVKDNEIHINGELGTRTYHQLKTAIENYPNAKTVVLGQINGSLNDAVNMHTGRILNEAGLTTKVLKNSVIASGGVDLFCAGKKRIVEKGAKLGIHSWCCFNDLTAAEIPKDHPAHQYQIEYFTMCMGEKTGPDFYFYTLISAPFDGVYWMTAEDIEKWNVETK